MKAHELACLVLRLMAIFCFVAAVSHLQGLVVYLEAFWKQGSELAGSFGGGVAVSMAFAPVAMAAVGMVLLLAAPGLGRWLAGGVSDKPIAGSWSGRDFQAMAFAVAGVVIVVAAVPTLGQIVGQVMVVRGQPLADEMRSKLLSDSRVQLWGAGLQVAMGLGLFFGAGGLSRLWHGLRMGGMT